MRALTIIIAIILMAVSSVSANEWEREKKICLDERSACNQRTPLGSKSRKNCKKVFFKCVKNTKADPNAKDAPKSNAEIDAGKRMQRIGKLGERAGGNAHKCASDIKGGSHYNPQSLRRAFLETCPAMEAPYTEFINEYNSAKNCVECQEWLETANQWELPNYERGVKSGLEVYPVVKEYTVRLFANYTPPETTCLDQMKSCSEEFGPYDPKCGKEQSACQKIERPKHEEMVSKMPFIKGSLLW